jgi:germination protein M
MKKRWFPASVALLLMPMALAGCLFGPEQKSSGAIDPPPSHAQNLDAQPVDSKRKENLEAKEQVKTSGVEMYFLSNEGYVVPWTLKLPTTKSMAKQAIKFMVKGGPGEALLPKGLSPVLPKGTRIKGLDIHNGTAVVDFSKEFLNYEAAQEEKILNAITWTLTGFPKVKEVNIWVEGKKLQVMPKNKTVAQGLTRNRGINLEPAMGVNLTRSMPVTVYFLGQTPDHTVYYVPVTRMVDRNDNVAEAVLRELVKGPLQNSGLSGALVPSLEIRQAKVQGDVVLADFGEELLQYQDQKAPSKEALQSIVLSLTENTGAGKVKILVGGKQQVLAEHGKELEQPVSRPQSINPSGL